MVEGAAGMEGALLIVVLFEGDLRIDPVVET